MVRQPHEGIGPPIDVCAANIGFTAKPSDDLSFEASLLDTPRLGERPEFNRPAPRRTQKRSRIGERMDRAAIKIDRRIRTWRGSGRPFLKIRHGFALDRQPGQTVPNWYVRSRDLRGSGNRCVRRLKSESLIKSRCLDRDIKIQQCTFLPDSPKCLPRQLPSGDPRHRKFS